MIIGLTGTLASGKGEASEYFVNKGYKHFRISDGIRKIAIQRGLDKDKTSLEYRKILQDIGNELREKYGTGCLARLIHDEISKDSIENSVIEGIRNSGEVKYFRDNLNDFFLIAIDAPIFGRYLRMIERKRDDDPKNLNEFMEMDNRDRGKDENEFGQGVDNCIKMSDYLIINDGTKDEFILKLDRLYDKIRYKNNISV